MRRLTLTTDDILNKEFKVDFKGYSAEEVDKFMDLVLNDYYTMIDNQIAQTKRVNEYENLIDELRQNLKETQVKNEMLEAQLKKIEEKGVNSIDVLKRLTKLEEMMHIYSKDEK